MHYSMQFVLENWYFHAKKYLFGKELLNWKLVKPDEVRHFQTSKELKKVLVGMSLSP